MIYMEHPVKSRYYLLFIEQDLFGTWRLIRAFGSLVSNRGRRMTQVCDNEKHAWYEMSEVEYKKRQRGYIYAALPYENGFYLQPQAVSEIIQAKIKKQKLAKQVVPDTDILANPNQQELFAAPDNNFNETALRV